MIGFAETLGATLASFLVPAFVGLFIIAAVARSLKPQYLAAFGVGLYLWFFSDTIGDAAYLSVDAGYTGGIWHFLVWFVFVLGLIFIFTSDRGLLGADPASPRVNFTIPLLVAVAIGVHGFGEGAAIGATALTAPGNDLLVAFGGASAGVAFVLHKALEPMMVGAAYWIYARDRATSPSRLLRDTSILVAVFSLPGILGSSIAYFLVQIYPAADFSYVFALGLGTSVYALARLVKPIFAGRTDATSAPPFRESLTIAAAIALGFTCLYLAALLHS